MERMAAKKQVWVAVALALAFGTVYGLALTRHVTEDAIKYVKDSLMGGEALFHPHHLFYHWIMAAAVQLMGAGPQAIDHSLLVMQAANVLLSVMAVTAIGILFYYRKKGWLGQHRRRR